MKQNFIKSIAWLCFGLLTHTQLSAQQDAQYTQYMYNPQVINPAYVGSRDVLSIVGLHRNQWVGINGSPRTNTLSINSPLGIIERVGLGLSIVNDEIGPVDESYISADFSYTIPTKGNNKFSFGLKGTLQVFSVNLNLLNAYDFTETSLNNSVENEISPNIGLGAFYYGEKFYVGLSVPNMLRVEYFDVTEAETGNELASREEVNYYVMGGYILDISPTVKFKPALMSKLVYGAPLQLDVSANFMWNNKIMAGVAYRWDAAISALFGIQLSDSFLIGFGYDYETTDIQQFNNGSYEVLMRFELFRKISRVLTPRFF